MSSPFGEDILEDIPIDDFKGATLRIDPASAQQSRSVSPSSGVNQQNDEKPPSYSQPDASNSSSYTEERFKGRPVLKQAISDPTVEIISPPSPDTCSNFYSGSGMSRSFYQQPPIGKARRASWHADTGIENGIREFFSVRVGALDQALEECRFLLDPELDGDIKGAWLLTEINHWDIEKERVVILCDLSLLVIKYDFIALHHVFYTRISLSSLEKLEHGEVTYPSHSLVPRISGIAGGVVTVIRGVIFNRLSSTLSKLSTWRGASSDPKEVSDSEEKPEHEKNFSISTVSFEPRWRNMQGIRITWNANYQLSFSQKWNPFCKDIPFTTFTSHPLYWYSGCENKTYDVKNMFQELQITLEVLKNRPDSASKCDILNNSIVIENYIGIASLLHNASELGFFKLRGKTRPSL
ncbi:UNVERIFIED_CONTAM: hypothetical protein RMT77_004154 [Armadillidium vulgare]